MESKWYSFLFIDMEPDQEVSKPESYADCSNDSDHAASMK